MNLDTNYHKLLHLLQVEFPLTPEPYRALGLRLGVSEEVVVRLIQQLKNDGIVRQISPVFDARRLGYRSTLVAMRVEASNLEKTAQLIMEHPGISHAYERDYFYNLWFTLSVPPEADAEAELGRLSCAAGAEIAFDLPATKLFKIGAYFGLEGDSELFNANAAADGTMPQAAELSHTDRSVINQLQQDLPMTASPFKAMARQLGMDEEQFLSQCRSLLQRGIMRRFGAAVNHRKAGFEANAMVCWIVPPDKVDNVGRKLASLAEVSHCYERKTNPRWPYNLFVMIHGRTQEACQEIARQASADCGLTSYVLLFSTREFKKTRVKYLV